jgi:hypothetical protein
MALQTIIAGGNNTAGQANVDSNYNVKVTLPLVSSQAGYNSPLIEVDNGAVSGTRELRALNSTRDNRLSIASPTILMSKTFPGTILNTGYWNNIATTQTLTLAAGFLTLNASNLTTINTGAGFNSRQSFPINQGSTTIAEIDLHPTNTPVPNTVSEWGLFNYTTFNGAITDGALFRFNAAGEFRCVLVTNSVELQSSTLVASTYAPMNITKHYRIKITEGAAEFYVGDIRIAIIYLDTAGSSTTVNSGLTLSARTYNTASLPSTATSLKIGRASVLVEDSLSSRSYNMSLSGMGSHSSYTQDGTTVGQTTLYTNNTAPTAAVPTNTTAALGTGLGGHFYATATAAVNTDLIISSYQNPVSSGALNAKTLYINAISIDTYVQTVLVGGGMNIVWYLSIGSTAVSETTTESATTKARRVIPLGIQTFAATAAATTAGASILRNMSSVPVYSGEFVKVCCRYVGTAATSGVYGHLIGIDGVFE